MNIVEAILALDSLAEVSVNNEDMNKITWHDGNPNNITKEQILAKQTELQAEYDAQEYARTRKPEYPDIGDQLDDLYHKGAFSDEMAVKIKAVKDAHPKPE